MKTYCIVNGDDFGACRGINRGILEAHQKGILTSTSLMVDMPGAEEAVRMAHDAPRLSVGLHVVLTREDGTPLIDFNSPDKCRTEIVRQWNWFCDLKGYPPTHLDAHHNIFRDVRLEPLFVELAAVKGVPLREHSRVRYFPEFFGQWDGETHLEQISEESLCHMLRTKIGQGFTELSCHPGYVHEDNYVTSYSIERETELQTICSRIVQQTIKELGIELINYEDLKQIASLPDKDGAK